MKWMAGALITTIVSAAALPVHARTLVFHVVPRVSEAPQIDGDLSDAAWRDAPAAETYYEYWKANPELGTLRTEFRMVYDDRGIYLAILNHDEHLDRLRADVTVRDDSRLWQDDCAEIYFDPAALGVGYTKFVANSIGTQQDLRRLDAAVTLSDWSGYGWNVANSKTDEGWTIEAFFPWSDLGARADTGDLWMFNHVRYAYTSGSFEGVTWSPGGNYNQPQNFGYLYFTDEATTSSQRVIELVSEAIDPPWRLPMGDGIYIGDEDGQVRFFEPEAWLDQARASVGEMLDQSRAVVADLPAEHADLRSALDACEKRYDQIATTATSPAAALDVSRRLDELTADIEEIYWRGRLHALLADAGH